MCDSCRTDSPGSPEPGWGCWGEASLKCAGSNGAEATAGAAGVGAEGGLVVLTETPEEAVDESPSSRGSVEASASLLGEGKKVITEV